MKALHFLVLAGVELESPSGRPGGKKMATTGDVRGCSDGLIAMSMRVLWNLSIQDMMYIHK